MMIYQKFVSSFLFALGTFVFTCSLQAASFRGEIVDGQTGRPVAARIYIQSASGEWLFPKSTAGEEGAVYYKRQRPQMPNSVEMHTALSAHPFEIELKPGKYQFTVVRGKEYREVSWEQEVREDDLTARIPIRRWIHMGRQGWFSGDTHVHRAVDELPVAVMAEDLNVVFPLTHWVTRSFDPPSTGNKVDGKKHGAEVIKVDATHVIYPRNTEYELFTVNGKRHTLGAVFVLNHKTVFDLGAPPVKPIAERARAEGALLDLDKHNWPWSMTIVPLMKVNLFELSNNHIWRTKFAFTNWAEFPAPYMKSDYGGEGSSEAGWLQYGLETYYALLNCGFNIKPTGGTASGVHPVPLGFGRVYVNLPGGFEYEKWVEGLGAGNSFVTTGPMLMLSANKKSSGATFATDGKAVEINLNGRAVSAFPLTRIEIIRNGLVHSVVEPKNRRTSTRGYETKIDTTLRVEETGWFAIRCFEEREGRTRFAHTAPWNVNIGDEPVRPRREQIDYLLGQAEKELKRSRSVLPPEAVAEYEEAVQIYRDIAKRAR